MRKMNNLEYTFMAGELGSLLAGKHFNRIRKLGDSAYRMKIGTYEVICELGVRIHLTKYLEEAESQDKFIEKLGKELDNARLARVVQLNRDRIISFEFDKGALIFEMFGPGNAILVRDGITVCAHKYESWSDREIKAGSAYQAPKNVPAGKLEVTDRYIIVSMTKLPLGKEYAAEALARLGIDEKKPGKDLSGNQIMALEREIESIRSSAKPCIFSVGGKIADFALAPLRANKGMEAKDCQTLSEAMDEYYSKLEAPNPKLEKLLERLEKQKERLALLLEEEKDYRSKGDYIYGKYQEIERLIETAREGRFAELGDVKVDKKERSIETDV